MNTATAQTFAEALNGRVVDHFGDPRVLIGGDILYCSQVTGHIKLDHRGRVSDLGPRTDGVSVIAQRYRAAVAKAGAR